MELRHIYPLCLWEPSPAHLPLHPPRLLIHIFLFNGQPPTCPQHLPGGVPLNPPDVVLSGNCAGRPLAIHVEYPSGAATYRRRHSSEQKQCCTPSSVSRAATSSGPISIPHTGSMYCSRDFAPAARASNSTSSLASPFSRRLPSGTNSTPGNPFDSFLTAAVTSTWCRSASAATRAAMLTLEPT